MDRAILMSVNPQQLHNILIGEQTFILQHTKPTTFEIYEYPFLVYLCDKNLIKAEFTCYLINGFYTTDTKELDFYSDKACIDKHKLIEYYYKVNEYSKQERLVYAWKIDNLKGDKTGHIVGHAKHENYKVRNISEFWIDKPPVNWRYINR